ncbi:uncharacterized protein LOC106999066 [Macaca mulatta]
MTQKKNRKVLQVPTRPRKSGWLHLSLGAPAGDTADVGIFDTHGWAPGKRLLSEYAASRAEQAPPPHVACGAQELGEPPLGQQGLCGSRRVAVAPHDAAPGKT